MTATGVIALMGSGELTATMVAVHKYLLQRTGPASRAVFLDTPAGFQLNADQIAQRAGEYFQRHIGRRLTHVAFKSRDIGPVEMEQALQLLRAADFVLIGPGSPTYTLRQLSGTPIPEILRQRVAQGGCLVAASAAALTVGRLTLPVYEIYKVGEEPHWRAGLDLLGALGIDAVVVPHWNNAEGGSHDTRRCFMGEQRFRRLEALLPPATPVLGLDEHTAGILDLASGTLEVRGLGSVTWRRDGHDTVIATGQRVALESLHGAAAGAGIAGASQGQHAAPQVPASGQGDFWQRAHDIETRVQEALEDGRVLAAANAVLELDSLIWSAQRNLESEEFISQGREILREIIVLLATSLGSMSGGHAALLVREMLELRERLRRQRQWMPADAIRAALLRAGVVVEDTPDGARWHRLSGPGAGSAGHDRPSSTGDPAGGTDVP